MKHSILKPRRNSVLLAWTAVLLGVSAFCGTPRILLAAPTPIPKTKPTPVPTPQPTPVPTPIPIPANVEMFTVPVANGDRAILPQAGVAAPIPAEVTFYLRRPAKIIGQEPARIVFICPDAIASGRMVIGSNAFGDIADERGWYLLSASFQPENALGGVNTTGTAAASGSAAAAVSNGNRSALGMVKPSSLPVNSMPTPIAPYGDAAGYSGKALQAALEQAKQKYSIATDTLFLQGYGTGAQFVHRFAIWQPERVAAVAVNSSSWFDDPNPKSAQVAWLVTIGEADPSCENSVDFLDKLRANGALPLFRSYIGMVHEGSSKVDEFNIIFLKFYDDATRAKLAARPMAAAFVRPAATPVLSDFAKKFQPKATPTPAFAPTSPLIPPASMPLVGDMKDWKIYKNEPQALQGINPDNLIYLPSPEIARMWSGKGIEEDGGQETGRNGSPY